MVQRETYLAGGRTCLRLGWSGHWADPARTDLRKVGQVQECPVSFARTKQSQVNKKRKIIKMRKTAQNR